MAKKKTIEERNVELAKEGLVIKRHAFKFRAYPQDKQAEKFHKSFGCARFTFNYYLNEKQEVYKETGKTLNYTTFKKSFLQLKDHPLFLWLAEPDKFALENAMMDVDTAFTNFFEGRACYPKFKTKHDKKKSYTTNMTNNNIELDVDSQAIKLPKVGWVSIGIGKERTKQLLHNGLPGRITAATFSYESNGSYFISLSLEEIVPLVKPKKIDDISDEDIIAGDLGLTHFIILSTGEKIDNPRYYRDRLKRLAKMQRRLSKMVKGSHNYHKQKKKIAKLHQHIRNMRHDFLHKISRRLVNENQVIILEDLHVKGMIRNRKLAKSIQDVGWGLFKTFVTYKAEWEGKQVVFIDRFYPSSKLCGHCETKNTMLSLSDREWLCPNCGCTHDRDENAAQNIKKEGIRLLQEAS